MNQRAKIANAGTVTVTEKTCNRCQIMKPDYMFVLEKNKRDGLSTLCRECKAASHKVWREDNPDAIRSTNLRRSYGITVEEYDGLLASQNGVCAFCGRKPAEKRRHAVDHDHVSGAIRGLLCLSCNKLRVANNTLEDAYKLLQYLKEPPADKFFGMTRVVPSGMEAPVRKKTKRRRRVTVIGKA